MKRNFIYIILTAGLAVLASCQEYEIDSQPELPPTVYVSALNEYSIAAAAPSRIVFNISANTPWVIETDSQWCIPTPAMSAESSLVSEIVINAEDNENETPRTAKLVITAEEIGVVKEITVVQAKMKEQLLLVLAEAAESDAIVLTDGMARDSVVAVSANFPWSLADSDIPEWLAVEKVDETGLKINATQNNMLNERSAQIRLRVQGTEETADFLFDVVQPPLFTMNENASVTIEPATGTAKVRFTQGEMFRSDFLMKKGRMTIELDEMQMSSRCNLGFVFLGKNTNANFKFHIEDTYWLRCAGAFAWSAPVKKAYTFDEVNAFRKLEFVVEDDPDAAGKLKVSLYINGSLYGSHSGRTNVFENGEEGLVFIFEAGLAPAPEDYCTFKSITYVNE